MRSSRSLVSRQASSVGCSLALEAHCGVAPPRHSDGHDSSARFALRCDSGAIKRHLRLDATLALLIVCASLGACSSLVGKRTASTPDNEPTLKTLSTRQIAIDKDKGIEGSEEKAIAAYRKFLDTAPHAPQRNEAMRRLGDLEMDSADNRSATGQAAAGPDYKVAIARYQDYLKTYPEDPGNDRVLYQLARAYEQNGQLEVALKTLDQLVVLYPNTAYRDEAHFRRGELLFTTRDYVKSEQAYATVLKGDASNPYQQRALYMQGWSLFKQGRLEEALNPFFGVLDLTVANRESDAALDTLPDLSRADRELVEDTFRVTSISLANLKGAESIPPYINSDARRSYEFRVYQQLGDFYIRQERVKDAADTFGTFVKLHPLHAQAPVLQARVIDTYQESGFGTLALDAKKDYVSTYGAGSEFRKANPAGWANAQPLVKTHLTELARYHHATAQKSKSSADYQEAVRWYRAYIASFPSDPATAQNNFLLAELLYEDSKFAEASVEYEKTAYQYPKHDKSADAGYAALLGDAQQEKRAAPADMPALQKASVASALRFAKEFNADPRTGPVLTNAAEKLYALKDMEQASTVAQQVLALQPPAAPVQRRVAWTVVAHTAFDRGAFDKAEQAYGEVLALTPEKEAGRNDLVERLAASVYKQGERARAEGKAREAVGHFTRAATVAPQSSVRATAQYDAAAALIGLKDWDAAARTLEDFRTRFPSHPLQSEVGSKLAVAYIEKQQWAPAAAELERISAGSKDPNVARDALWQAAELYEKGGSRGPATKAYTQYVKQYPNPLEPAVEARLRLAGLAKQDGNAAREFALMKEIFQVDQAGGSARTNRTRYLGATAALTMAEPVLNDYKKIQLVEPLARQLKLKKAKMEEVLKAYAVASDYGVADVSTAATYYIATVYQDFGKALMSSQRPKKLSKIELEQYNVMLEEQAYPFEEKSMELHEVNARRAADGIYDKWVKDSFTALREMRPVRYGKVERSEGVVDRQAGKLPEAVADFERAVEANPKQPVYLNQLGVSYRQNGQFAKARDAYERAIAIDENYAMAVLNLAILNDMYLWDGKRALELYDRYLALTPGGDPLVSKWIADLKNRKQAPMTAGKKEKA
ncbi:MAG: tetratricopeptide repeat protein [Burkholderiales bacterium]|nr:tetratricopeptide repeat protein [Burkholderiales bacterium]